LGEETNWSSSRRGGLIFGFADKFRGDTFLINKTHEAVMVEEVLTYLVVDKNGVYIDCTFGAGGHSQEILNNLQERGRLIGIDRDISVKDRVPQNLKSDERFSLISDRFSNLKDHVKKDSIDGILVDLGISSTQLDDSDRGFSFQSLGPLDMRMDQSTGISAEQWINTASKKEIEDVFWVLGEERASRRVAKVICERRIKQPFTSTKELAEIVLTCIPRRGKKHPATNIFRAIRMQVNEEMEELYSLLESSGSLLREGGRLAIISFHSIEDRVVKRFIQGKDRISSSVNFKTVGGKHVKPTKEEIKENPRSRSAILRVAEKVA
jgi:16S rRNA (cytosine1402-N4)-methyltransferase